MSDNYSNPYVAPTADLEQVPEVVGGKKLYLVSIRKFTILFFVTMGSYSFYWFYKNWKEYKAYSGDNVWPVPRAIFSIFFTHRLFAEVQDILRSKNKKFVWSPKSQATFYVVLAVISSILDKMSRKDIGSPVSDVLSLLIIPLLYMPLLKAQKAINLSQDDPEGRENDRLTGANYIWIVLGICVWLAVLFSLMIIFGFVELP